MDFIDEVKALAARVPGLLGHIVTEAGTRTSLVEPFIRALGYDTSDPTEVAEITHQLKKVQKLTVKAFFPSAFCLLTSAFLH